MAEIHADGRRATAPPDLPAPEQPLQAVLPNLDKMSRSSFTPGTVSRRRINHALLGLLAVGVIVAVGLVGSTLLGWI